jgi:DNA polymerase-3 subunit alpha
VAKITSKKVHENQSIEFTDVKTWYDRNLHPDVIDLNDKAVFKDIYHAGRWAGVFQFTARGAQQFCQRAKPNSVLDIAAVTSIYRPGPLVAGVDKTFVQSKENPDAVAYEHPLIKEVLGETYGLLVFQEQMLRLGHVVGKMPLAKCDRLRKVITKRSMSGKEKAQTESEALGNEFIQGALENGFTEEMATKLWDNMSAFKGYAFNLSLSLLEGITKYTSDGKSLGEFPIKDLKPGDFVKSRDESTQQDIFVEVQALHDHGIIELFEFETDDGRKVRCSMNHKFRTTDGRMLPMKQIIKEGLEIVSLTCASSVADEAELVPAI